MSIAHPEDPRCHVELKAPETLFLESPLALEVILRRNDTDPRSCIFYWPPDIAARFVLLRHTSHGLERVEVAERRSEAPDVLYVGDWRQYLFELQPHESSRYLELLHSYRRVLRPGERYELLWPGAKTCIWDWGDIQDHLDMELRRRESCISIVGGSNISFTVEEGERTFPSPEPSPPSEPLSRVPGAPVLSLNIECSPTFAKDQSKKATVHVIYHSSCKGPDDSTPITFHTVNLLSGNLQRRRGQNWEYFESEEMPYQIYDDPDIEVTPGRHADFISLQPGEQWTRTDSLELPSDIDIGEVFKYEFSDRVIDWWDWGMKEDHLQTTVKLPCWVKDDVVEPRDNEGRPAIVVPASNVVEFTIV
ncbi:unnamed protein product [Aspergillus oryzae]|uniref:Unnamed protein product n=2 Tax=Aspergillus oryzae TaxID=5062 RepID=A0AAN4YAQ0_ASPOZ|nr:unnamed protein product [Aspergillus oryzae]GMF88023.1 unnamed protein product [Aspergillus oryzae]GMG06526.1 unnamed protein product [Aspergillus oryzae]GMG24366.1 unnamed protein product [Aspergillus oryzae]GMG47641.1 unnamed protein product [Aspergillus oryzae var. brunneus]